jgi:hypothetical protein
MLKFPAEYDKDTSPSKLEDMSRHVTSAMQIDVSADICHRALMYESGLIITQMGTHNRSENDRSAWDAFYDTAP